MEICYPPVYHYSRHHLFGQDASVVHRVHRPFPFSGPGQASEATHAWDFHQAPVSPNATASSTPPPQLEAEPVLRGGAGRGGEPASGPGLVRAALRPLGCRLRPRGPRTRGHSGWSPERRTGVDTASRPSAPEKAEAAKRPRSLQHSRTPGPARGVRRSRRDKSRSRELGRGRLATRSPESGRQALAWLRHVARRPRSLEGDATVT